MLAASHPVKEFDLSSAEAHFRSFALNLEVSSGHWLKRWRANQRTVRSLKLIGKDVDYLNSFDFSTVSKELLFTQAPRVGQFLLTMSDFNERLENTPSLSSKRLKRQVEVTLNKFFALERKWRLAAFPDDTANPDDAELAVFNNTLSRNLFHQKHAL